MAQTVLVTGGTGFVAGWAIQALLAEEYDVRTTVRNLARADRIRTAVDAELDNPSGDRLTFVEADLLDDRGWGNAVAGCTFVLHVASPLIATRHEEEVIRPAVDGALRVLRASRDAGVRRVVVTSSCGAVYYGHPAQPAPFDESSWTVIGGGPMSAYVKSKALAERAAWDFMEREGGSLELAVINPTGIFGPALDRETSSSLGLIGSLIDGRLPAVPDLWFGIVDVRDVVDLHLRAMVAPEAAGQRFIATGTEVAISMRQVADELRAHLGPDGSRIPRRRLPSFAVRLIGRFNPEIGALVPLLGERRSATSAKAIRELGWTPRPWQQVVDASADSLRRIAAE